MRITKAQVRELRDNYRRANTRLAVLEVEHKYSATEQTKKEESELIDYIKKIDTVVNSLSYVENKIVSVGLNSNCSLNDLAMQLGYSREHTSRTFNKGMRTVLEILSGNKIVQHSISMSE